MSTACIYDSWEKLFDSGLKISGLNGVYYPQTYDHYQRIPICTSPITQPEHPL